MKNKKPLVISSAIVLSLLSGSVGIAFASSTNNLSSGTKTNKVAATSLSTKAVSNVSKPFTDVNSSYGFYTEIEQLRKDGVIEGYNNTSKYEPGKNITRGDAAKILVKAMKLNLQDPKYKDVDFKDVSKSNPLYPYVKAIVNEHVFDGKTNGQFGINENLSRAQMAKVLVLAFKLKGDYPVNFKDVKSSDWAHDYIDTLAASEVTIPYWDLTFKPSNPVTRGQMAAFVYRATYDNIFKDKNILNFYSGTGPFQLGDHLVKNGVLLFGEYGKYKDYLPSSKLNPYINRQIYVTVKSLLNKDTYTDVRYDKSTDFGNSVIITYSTSSQAVYNGNFAFKYILNENNYVKPAPKYSNKAIISLFIQSLWFDGTKVNKAEYAEPLYKQKLKDSLINMFGNEGTAAFDFIFKNYVSYNKNYNPNNKKSEISKSTVINKKLQVDFITDRGEIAIYFTNK